MWPKKVDANFFYSTSCLKQLKNSSGGLQALIRHSKKSMLVHKMLSFHQISFILSHQSQLLSQVIVSRNWVSLFWIYLKLRKFRQQKQCGCLKSREKIFPCTHVIKLHNYSVECSVIVLSRQKTYYVISAGLGYLVLEKIR